MYKLYYSPGACSMAVHIALNELNTKFELVNSSIPAGKTKTKEFLAINPRGNVPVLEVDGYFLREGAAILIYLLDNNKNDLLPKSGLERAKALEWLAFANATLHPAYGRVFFMRRVLGAEEAPNNALYQPALEQIQKYWNELENHFDKNQYVCGDKCTIADILITVIANWSANFGSAIKFGSKTKNYFSKIISRPSYKKALEIEEITYKANL